MEIFWDIVLHTVEILTLLFGVLGMAFSLLLLFSPRLTKSLSSYFNRSINVESKINFLDKDIPTEAFIYSHHVVFGVCLVSGLIFTLIFFFFSIDISNFAKVFLGSRKYFMTLEVVFIFFAWVTRLACIFGLVFGFFLLFAPAKMQAIEGKMNNWFETQAIFEKLDRSGPELDVLFFRYPFFFGMAGAVVSFLIITLATVNLLS
jgi:hypothetical protein